MELLVAIAVVFLFIYGYIANFAKLFVNEQEDGFVKLVRFIGLFFPLVGAILGFIN